MARTSSGVFLIWYFMWMGLVEMNVWMRGTSASRTASQQTRTSCSMARASPAMRAPLTSRAIRATDSKSPLEATGKPASITSTPRRASWWAISSFSVWFSDAPGACSPSRSVVSKIFTVRAPALPPDGGRGAACPLTVLCSVTSLTPLSGSGYAKGTQNPDSRFERKGWPCGRRC